MTSNKRVDWALERDERRKSGFSYVEIASQVTVKYPHSLMIWLRISADGVGHLNIIDGTINVRKYIDTILEPKLLPPIRDLFTNNASFIFQQDSTPCHTIK
ncbi:transposable element Tcb1 transposase [Trichonephila clavipes]|nr:transposable element Tcb1 transposase [Trichonephila clavipes]